MNIIKSGNEEYRKDKTDEFYFKCEKCECEWTAKRSEVNFTPPWLHYMEFGVYMACPTCGQLTDYKL